MSKLSYILIACVLANASVWSQEKAKDSIRIGLGIGLSKGAGVTDWRNLEKDKVETLDGLFSELGGWPKAPFKIGSMRVKGAVSVQIERDGKSHIIAWILGGGEIRKGQLPKGGLKDGDVLVIVPTG